MRYLRSGLISLCLLSSTAAIADCRNSGNFEQWLDDYKREAIGSGLSAGVVNSALAGISFDQSVIERDRSQGVFAQTFLEFASKKVSSSRLSGGQKQMKSNAKLFRAIEERFGVPPEILTAFWALETDFGANTGSFPTLRALATLAYDCRRPELFRPELTHALSLIQKGDQTPANMKGAWAGELGQLQFLPSGYNLHAVDFDGDGRRDLIRSKADALASAASLLQEYGWRAGQPWLIEVKVPQEMDWSQARMDNKLPLSQWAAQGVTLSNGQALRPSGNASLLLPMGRNGPAFLAFPNFDAILRWNESTVYATTAAYLATRFDGARPLRAGHAPVTKLSVAQVKQLQAKLQARGLGITKIDGIIGEETRAAVRQMQEKLGMPADGYPDPVLLGKL